MAEPFDIGFHSAPFQLRVGSSQPWDRSEFAARSQTRSALVSTFNWRFAGPMQRQVIFAARRLCSALADRDHGSVSIQRICRAWIPRLLLGIVSILHITGK